MSDSQAIRRLQWYRNRLRSMSVGELGHRVVEAGKRAASRRMQPSPDRLVNDVDADLPVIPGLREDMLSLVPPPAVLDTWRRLADGAVAGRFELLGKTWPGERGTARWHIDPISGNAWPSEPYCFSIPRNDVPGFGDVKYVWELNRLQYLQPIAALAACTGNDTLARFCADEIESWIDGNPPFLGLNWASGIELAMRVVSIAWVVSMIGPRAFTRDQRRKLTIALAHHGYWLERFPSLFSSANNHYVAEIAGLYLLGRLVPGLACGQRYAAEARAALCREIDLQIHPDGVGAEQSPSYQGQTLEWLLICREVGRRTGDTFPEAYDARLAAAGEFLRWVTDQVGYQPRIGDDDDGQILFSGGDGPAYARNILAGIATSLDRRDLIPPASVPHLRQALLGRPGKPKAAPLGVRQFAAGGYTIHRWARRREESLLVFDHGPLGYFSIAAHGHADALALWMHVGAQPVFVDAGTYLYAGPWRQHFRSTPAHNTLSVAGTDSSVMTGAFNWGRRADTRIVAADVEMANWFVEAEHDGFVATHGVRHRRRIERVEPGRFLIHDTLVGSGGPWPVEIGFLVHPRLSVSRDDGNWVVDGPNRRYVTVATKGPLKGTVIVGRENPSRGWYSPRFSSREPTPLLQFSGMLAADEVCTFDVRVTTA